MEFVCFLFYFYLNLVQRRWDFWRVTVLRFIAVRSCAAKVILFQPVAQSPLGLLVLRRQVCDTVSSRVTTMLTSCDKKKKKSERTRSYRFAGSCCFPVQCRARSFRRRTRFVSPRTRTRDAVFVYFASVRTIIIQGLIYPKLDDHIGSSNKK